MKCLHAASPLPDGTPEVLLFACPTLCSILHLPAGGVYRHMARVVGLGRMGGVVEEIAMQKKQCGEFSDVVRLVMVGPASKSGSI